MRPELQLTVFRKLQAIAMIKTNVVLAYATETGVYFTTKKLELCWLSG